MEQNEALTSQAGTRITSSEISRRMNSNVLQQQGIRFQDLTVNKILLVGVDAKYSNRSTDFNESLGYLRMEHNIYWKDDNESLTVKEVNTRDKNGDLKAVREKIENLTPLDPIETEIHHSIGDYSFEDETSFFVRIGDGDNRVILRIDYPTYINYLGSMTIFMNPNDPNLEKHIAVLQKSISILASEKLLPEVNPDKVNLKFEGLFDEQSIFNQIENLKLNNEKYKLCFEKDLSVIKNLEAREGYHRAIVYFLGHDCGLLFLQNTDYNNSFAVGSHARVLESWLNDPNRSELLTATGFATDSMVNYMHTFIKFDEKGDPVPEWFTLGGFTEQEIALYLSENFGIKNEFGLVPENISKQLALSGGLGEKILTDAELLRSEYGKNYAARYVKLAEKFRIKEVEPFSAGWDEFQAMEVLINQIRSSKRK